MMRQAAARYTLGGSDGNWSVIDTRTGGPALVAGCYQTGFADLDDADDLADALNYLEIVMPKDRARPLRLVVNNG